MENPFQAITNDLSEIKNLISNLYNQQPKPAPEDDLIDVHGAAKLLKKSVGTVYNLVSKNEIPRFKRGKKLYFSKNSLIQYIQEGKKLTNKELKDEVNNTLHQQKNRANSKGYTLPERVEKFTSTIDIDDITTEEAAEEAGKLHFDSNEDLINDKV